ncbi:hypothetical protein TrispH2_003562 [Trichoplax sp. H2]|nr:hypothetical protein TrispH2_003562 [Trichoplax sp. H2]|eukprot:RDD45540.1 hypothetical protein TrispH2_003562 [Trichoplax sp. H2]
MRSTSDSSLADRGGHIGNGSRSSNSTKLTRYEEEQKKAAEIFKKAKEKKANEKEITSIS